MIQVENHDHPNEEAKNADFFDIAVDDGSDNNLPH